MSVEEKLMSKKKPAFPVSEKLNKYLVEHSRTIKIPVFYDDLLRFQGSVVVYDKNDEDTLWVRTYYAEHERVEIDLSLKKIYTILHSNGNEDTIQYLSVDAVDYCTFGNSKPFRIKIRNILNDNYTYFYVKITDASRVYGLELEHILSPHNLNFLVYKNTLIEEHISGIPGDDFIKDFLPKCNESEKAELAKEFVKFNERCMIRLLGDMRSYNYVVVPTHDFDHIVYKIRAIDFDQQSFEGKLKVYNLQYFKENYKMVEMISKKLQISSIEQYKIEERSIMAKRMISSYDRITELIDCMKSDTISYEKNVEILKNEVCNFTNDADFKKCQNMGEILETILSFVKRNYLDTSAV
jgi:aspartate carbamoyltransferase regulatory subunit